MQYVVYAASTTAIAGNDFYTDGTIYGFIRTLLFVCIPALFLLSLSRARSLSLFLSVMVY